MIKERNLESTIDFIESFEDNDIDLISTKLTGYQEKCEKDTTISDILLESHRFFNDFDSILRSIVLDLKKTS